MLDLKLIRSQPEQVKQALARRGVAEAVDPILVLDEKRRELLQTVEGLRAEQNEASELIGAAKRSGENAQGAIDAMQSVASKLKQTETLLRETEQELEAALAELPNLPDPTAAEGESEADAVVVKTVGEPPQFDFPVKDHLEIGTDLGLIDMERAAQTSGARFAYLLGDLVRLELALVNFAFDRLSAHGFTPVIPPVLVREEAMYGTGFLPTDRAQIYETKDDNLFLVGTSEVPLAAFHQDEVLAADDLPLRYAGFSTCFRREAGAAGKDTRGIFRVHQFEKVEMFSFCLPDKSTAEHELLLSIEEGILQELEIPYRVVNVAVGDLGASAAKKYDCEAWMPGQARYREVTSTSNTTDYQARRLRCRYKEKGGKPEVAHTLNGTALALGRTMIAVIENHQQKDGSVALPMALKSFGAPKALKKTSYNGKNP